MVVAYYIKQFSLGGGPRAIYHLCKAMSDVQFHIFAMPGIMEKDFAALDNVCIHHVKKWSFIQYTRTLAICMKMGVEVVHFHSFVPAIYAIFFGSLPMVYTFHGIHYRKYNFKSSYAKKYLRYILMYMLLKKTDKAVVLCEDDREYLQKIYAKKININKLRVIPNVVTEPNFSGEYNFPGDNHVKCLIVARYDFQKGIDILLDMLLKLPALRDKFSFYFIGDGYVKEMVYSAQKAGCTCVDFLTETCEPYMYMKAADLLVIPSRWEGLPMVVLEALLLGTKVVAADTANVNYLCDNKNLFLYEQYDAESFISTLNKAVAEITTPVDLDLSMFSAGNVGNASREMYKKLVDG